MGEEIQTRGATDVFKWWLFMATDIIGELSFGESFRMLEAGEVSNTYIQKYKTPKSILTPNRNLNTS